MTTTSPAARGPNQPDRAAGRWISALFRSGGFPAMAALAAPLAGGALLVWQASLLASVLDDAIVGHRPLAEFYPALAGLVILISVRTLIGVAGEAAAVRSAERLKRGLRIALFETILQRGPTWTATRSSGALSALMIEQVEALDGFLVRYMPAMVGAAVLPVAFAAIVLPVDWVVGLLFLVTAPLIPVFMMLAGWGAEAASRAQAAALGRLAGRFADRLRGMVTLKLFGREAAETEAVFAASEDLRRRSMRVMRIAFLSSAVLEFFAALGVAGVALYVGLSFLGLVGLHGGAFSLGAGLFCLLMAPEVYQPLRLLAAHYHDRAAAKAAASEIAGLLGELPMPATGVAVAAPTAPLVPVPAVGLILSTVRVDAPDGGAVILCADLSLAPGDHIAIVGRSGIGKSTLLEAVARLRGCTGEIVLGGDTPLADLPEPLLRGHLAFLGQRPRIFAGTIAENIRLGRADADDLAVRTAAGRACVLEFADALPEGLETLVGEGGLGLSGGEVQRIALARLYLRAPGIVLLDEPTAHLDLATEGRVLDGLMDFAAGRTLIVATHSEAVAARMARVCRIEAGRLVEGASLS